MEKTKEKQPKRLRGSLNFKLQKKDMEIPRGASLTIPDDSFTVSELIEKHSRGIALGIQRLGTFENLGDDEYDSIDMEAFERMEITEQKEIMERMGERVQEFKEHKANWLKAKKEKEEKEKREKKARIEAKKGINPLNTKPTE